MENIKFNKCQTPLEDLHLEKYPKEVQDQWWDFLNNVPFIKWMVSEDRPLVSELPRDKEGRAIIDITHPPILEGSDYFRPSALAYKKNKGRYTTLRPNANPNSDFGKWLYEERKRGWNGYCNPDTGMWVTGDYYWMLNFCPMHLVEKNSNGVAMRTVAHPRFWDGQFLMSHYLNQGRRHGHHASALASRGRGKTSFGAGLLSRRCIIGESEENSKEVQCMVTAVDRTKLMDTNMILKVFKDNLDHCAKYTQFASHRLKSSDQEMEWKMGYKKAGSEIEYGSKNSVSGIISGVNQDKLNGSRGVLYLIEEAGIFKNLLSMYNMMFAKAIVSANLRTLEAISILTKTDALNLAPLLVFIDKLQVNTSFFKLTLELLPAICDFQSIIDGIVNLVFGTLRIAQFASVSLALVRSVSQSILGF